jgi:hypothetical protein
MNAGRIQVTACSYKANGAPAKLSHASAPSRGGALGHLPEGKKVGRGMGAAAGWGLGTKN